MATAQTISGEYNGEWEWDFNNHTNFVNLLRFDFEWSPWKNGTIEAATIHIARTNDPIIPDRQVFSNVYEENNYASIAVLGYKHSWQHVNLFVGVRNSNEDFFTSETTSFFTNSSLGIFPTIAASYPIPNYPVSSLNITLDFTFGNWTITEALYNGVGYSGWKKNDNPFLVRPKRDGIYDELQVAYETERSFYSVGAAMHTKEFIYDEEGDFINRNKFSAALWAYGEQTVWEGADDQKVRLMAQLSFNTNSHSACTSYAEVGCTYGFGQNTIGVSGQYCRFHDAEPLFSDLWAEDDFCEPTGYSFAKCDEYSVELTWQHEFNEHLSVQPSFQYIHTNRHENYTALLGRLTYSF